MTENCRTNPTKTGQGILNTRPKSATLRVVPIPNIIIWIKGTISIFKSTPNQEPKAVGYTIDAATNAKTQAVKVKLLRNGWLIKYRANEANITISAGPSPARRPEANMMTTAARQITNTNLKYLKNELSILMFLPSLNRL